MKDVHEVVSVVVTSLPNDFKEFIKWVAEVRRQDDASATLTEEEKGRLAVKVCYILCIRFSSLSVFSVFPLKMDNLHFEFPYFLKIFLIYLLVHMEVK